MVRKLMLVVVRAAFAEYPVVQASLVCIVLTFSLSSQLSARPFTHRRENVIENISLLVHALVLAAFAVVSEFFLCCVGESCIIFCCSRFNLYQQIITG